MKEKIAQIIYNKKYESKTFEECLEITELILEILEVVQPERLNEETIECINKCGNMVKNKGMCHLCHLKMITI